MPYFFHIMIQQIFSSGLLITVLSWTIHNPVLLENQLTGLLFRPFRKFEPLMWWKSSRERWSWTWHCLEQGWIASLLFFSRNKFIWGETLFAVYQDSSSRRLPTCHSSMHSWKCSVKNLCSQKWSNGINKLRTSTIFSNIAMHYLPLGSLPVHGHSNE